MDVSDVEAIPIEMDVKSLEENDGIAPYRSSRGPGTGTKQRIIIRIDLENGITGWGEMRLLFTPEISVQMIEDVVAPRILGHPVWDIGALQGEFFSEYIRISPFLGGVEMAMWDAFGKTLDAPVHQLLGGKQQDKVSFAYCLGILDPDKSRTHAQHVKERGFDVLKTKAGRDWQEDVDRILAMYDAVDGSLEFRLDPNQAWTFEEAVRVGAKLEDAGVYLQYFEQPIRIDNVGGFKRLRQRLQTPIGANEDMYYPHNLFQLVKEDAIDVGIVDMNPAGGISAMRDLASVAHDAGISISHHCSWDLGIKTAAVVHAVSAMPPVNLPSDTVYFSWKDHIIESPFEFNDGRIDVPDEPGLGVAVRESKIAEYRIE